MKIIDMHRHNSDPDEVEKLRTQWDALGYAHVCYSGNLADLREQMARYPGYVIGFAYLKMDDGSVPWRNPELSRDARIAVDELDRYQEQGFRGLKVIYTQKPYSHPDYFPYYERAQKLGMPILFHTGWVSGGPSGPVRRHENYRPVYLQTIASNFPELNVICAHLGGWQFSMEAVVAMWKHPNVYADLCGATMYRRPTAYFRDLFCLTPPAQPEQPPELDLDIFGRLVYGTDNCDEEIFGFYQRLFKALNVPQAVQEKVYWGNMAALLKLEQGAG